MAQRGDYGENPFTPGAGRSPPYLAGRDAVLQDWRSNQRESGLFNRPEILMYGPRGMGKTAILREFQLLARDQDCNLVRASAPILNHGEDAMADKLLAPFESPSYVDSETTTSEVQAGGGVPGFAQAGATTGASQTVRHRSPSAGMSLEARLQAIVGQKPLVLLLDEAHAVTGETASRALSALVNAVQQLVSEDHPVCLVLAGTPGLPQTLVEANCSFDERFHEIGIGLLDTEAAKAVIEKPLAEHVWRRADPASRLGIESAALEALVEDSGGYPYFLQIWGSVLWDQAAVQGADTVTLAGIASARKAVDALRLTNYQRRSEEIDFDSDVLVSANAIAESFRQYYAKGDARRIEWPAIINVVEEALTRKYPMENERDAVTKRCVKQLTRVGFVWRPPGSRYMEPGIPSFLTYAQELYAIRRGNRQAHAL